jgi:hypothetical protein
MYLEKDNVMTSIRFEFKKFSNKEIHDNFGNGITNVKEYCYNLNKFGMNTINFESKSWTNIFISQCLQPLYLYQIFSITNWYQLKYNSMATVILFLMIITLVVNSTQQYKNYQKILSFSLQVKAKICRYLVNDNLSLEHCE